jgi:hypothetical protein
VIDHADVLMRRSELGAEVAHVLQRGGARPGNKTNTASRPTSGLVAAAAGLIANVVEALGSF